MVEINNSVNRVLRLCNESVLVLLVHTMSESMVSVDSSVIYLHGLCVREVLREFKERFEVFKRVLREVLSVVWAAFLAQGMTYKLRSLRGAVDYTGLPCCEP